MQEMQVLKRGWGSGGGVGYAPLQVVNFNEIYTGFSEGSAAFICI